MSKLSLPPLSNMPNEVQAAFRAVAAWAAGQDAAVQSTVETVVQKNTQVIIRSQLPTTQQAQAVQQARPAISSEGIVRSVLSNSDISNPIEMYSSVLFRAGTSQTGVAIGAGGIGGTYAGVPTWAVASADGSFFFGAEDAGYPSDPAHKQIIFDATAGTFQFGKDIVVQTSAGPKTLDTISTASGYSTANLTADLAAGVGKIVAGVGSNYRLNVDIATGFITAAHKDAVFKGTAAVGSVKPAIGITATGIAMGYNRSSDGVWVDSVAIDASGNASFSGAINATSGNFTGTVTAGSIITDSVTVGGTALSVIKAGAASGSTAVQPAALANFIDRTASTTLSGTISPASGVANAGAFKIGTVTWDTAGALTGGSGIAITAKGIIGAASGVPTFSIDSSTGAALFAGQIATSKSISADGTNVTGIFGGISAAIVANCTTAFGAGAIYGKNSGVASVGVYGESTIAAGTGMHAKNGAGGTALYCEGLFGINNSTLVTNLNANYLGGNLASAFYRYVGPETAAGTVGGKTAYWSVINANGGTYYALIAPYP